MAILQRLLRQLGPYLGALLVLLVLRQARLGETVNLLLYDLASQLRPAPSGATTAIRIIGVEEADLRSLGWPLDDGLLADAIERLQQAGVRAVGLDLYRDLGVGTPEGRQRLRELAARMPRLVSVFSHVDGIAAIPTTPPSRRAYNDLLIDPDGVVRRDLLHVRGQDPEFVALPMRLLEVARDETISPLRRRIEARPASVHPLDPQAGGYTRLDSAGVQRMLPFHQPRSFPEWSLRQLLAGQVPERQLKDSIVLIGSRAPSLRDGFQVPFSRPSPLLQLRAPLHQQMSGVEVHAHRLASLLALDQGRPLGLRAAPGWMNGLLLLAGLVAGVALGEGMPSLRRSLRAVALVTAGALLAGGLALAGGLWLNVALPIGALLSMAAAALLRRGAEQQRQRQEMQRLLGQTTSVDVAQDLWNHRHELLEGGRFRGRALEATVLFTDIEHFTAVAEQLPPDALLEWLNRGMAEVVPLVHAQGGLVNKFTGDGLLAVFGAPLSQGPEADAVAAVRTAIAIRAALQELNRQLAREGQPAMRLRIGVHSGPVVAGSVGSRERWEFGVVGDTVNCAARIEALDKERSGSPCRVLVSGVTRARVQNQLAGPWRDWGTVALSGRSTAVEIWELVAPPADPAHGYGRSES